MTPEQQALVTAFQELQSEDAKLFYRKQLDYGPENISDSYNLFGLASILIRMNDKMRRLMQLSKSGEAPQNESIEDSLIDLANYALIARLCLRGDWPGVKNG